VIFCLIFSCPRNVVNTPKHFARRLQEVALGTNLRVSDQEFSTDPTVIIGVNDGMWWWQWIFGLQLISLMATVKLGVHGICRAQIGPQAFCF
jgi:hypothetical protein